MSSETAQRIYTAPVVYVCAITGFEVGIKWQKGKLELPAAPKDWFDAVLEHHDLHALPLSIAICLRSTALPRIHSDPCDRMIIASALVLNLPIVTHDPIFDHYGVHVLK